MLVNVMKWDRVLEAREVHTRRRDPCLKLSALSHQLSALTTYSTRPAELNPAARLTRRAECRVLTAECFYAIFRPFHQRAQGRVAAPGGLADAARPLKPPASAPRGGARAGAHLPAHGLRPRHRARREPRPPIGELPQQPRHTRARTHLPRRPGRGPAPRPRLLRARLPPNLPPHLALHGARLLGLPALRRADLPRHHARPGVLGAGGRASLRARADSGEEAALV